MRISDWSSDVCSSYLEPDQIHTPLRKTTTMEEDPMKKLENKVALITGAAGGIGSATAERFVAEGARVILAAKDEEEAKHLAEKMGVWALPIGMGLGDEASVVAGVNAGKGHFGKRLDTLFPHERA